MLATTAASLLSILPVTLASIESLLLESSHVTGYILIAVLLLSSGFGAPIPEDIPLLIGGWLCALEQTSLAVMLPLAWIFVLAGDCVLYFLGRRYGHHVPRIPGLRRVLTPHRIERTERFFQKHGGKTLFFVRFLAAVRASTWFVAGAVRIPFWKFVAYDGAAALIFAPGLVLLGFQFGPRGQEIGHYVRWGQLGLTLLLILALGITVTIKLIRRRTTRS